MKKLLGIVVLSLFLINPSYSETLNIFCLIGVSDLKKAKLNPAEYYRFAGKVIKFKINFDENLIYDVSDESELSVISGINQGPINFRKTSSGIKYTNEFNVKGDTGELIKYNYNNDLFINKNGNILKRLRSILISRIYQSDLSNKSINLSIGCRGFDYTDDDIRFAGGSKKGNLIKDTTNYDILDLQSYVANDIDSLLLIYKARLFKNNINNWVFLKIKYVCLSSIFIYCKNYLNFEPGQKLEFEDIKNLNEKQFFGLPLHNSGDRARLKKLKKEYLKKKNKIKEQE